jgi:CxxC-x17-CxxC domain-containing protein
MTLENKNLVCRDCEKTFVFSAGEQEFFNAKGLTNEPKRCSNCRILMRAQRNGEDPKHTAEVNCAQCNMPTRVPFQPKGYRPVYCGACFRSKKTPTEDTFDAMPGTTDKCHDESPPIAAV